MAVFKKQVVNQLSKVAGLKQLKLQEKNMQNYCKRVGRKLQYSGATFNEISK